MAPRSLEQMTFREKIRDCAHKTRELIEHLEQGFAPRLQELHAKAKPPRPGHEDDIPDVTIRNLVAAVLESHRYAEQLEEQIEAYGRSIDEELNRMLTTPGI
uniref:Uncharacterized protein n=1 Tax=Schlesneria paludicola TaxID=360056 RepID=A0A7C4LNB8_9PLAN